MLHSTHHCTSIQILLPRSPLQYPTGLESPSHTILLYGYIRGDIIHDPILKRMRSLPCQKSDTVLWWTCQSLRRWRPKTNDVQKHPTLCTGCRRLHQRQPQREWPKFRTEVSLQCIEECVDDEVWDDKVYNSPHELRIDWSMGCLQGVIWKHHQTYIF